MARRVALAVLTISSFAALACLFIEHPFSTWLFGFAGLLFIPALIGLGAARGGRLGALALPLFGFGLYLILCLGAMLWLSPGREIANWWFGLPPAAVLMLVGLWLLPLPAVAFAYAWYFERKADEP